MYGECVVDVVGVIGVLGKDGECVLFGGFYDYIEGFCYCDVEFVDGNWMDI